MSITSQHTQELLQRAYLLAVAADAGFNISLGAQLDYGVDAFVSRVGPVAFAGQVRLLEKGIPLRVQLKAAVSCRMDATHISYDCDAAAYNKMAVQNQETPVPIVLIVFCQPTERSQWLSVSEDSLTLCRACYWYFVTGALTEKTSQVIRIPRTQLFSPAALTGIMERINQGGRP